MNITKKAQAGSFESGDIMILVEPNDKNERSVEVSSSVETQFGEQIRNLIDKKLDELQIDSIRLIAKDKGALDPTICARIETAVKRASDL
ncbi:MAG: citrate lyase acyl carrier protein [Bacteroidales bacterium]|nr:citrate lyase acyl carrier protein [Bacteroidales bacterium]